MVSLFENWKALNEAPITKSDQPKSEFASSATVKLAIRSASAKSDQKAFFMPRLLTLETDPAVFMGYYDPFEASRKWMEGIRMEPFEYREFMSGNFKQTRCYFELPKHEPTLAEEVHRTSAEELNAGAVHMESNSGSTQEMAVKLAHEKVYTKKDLAWFDGNNEELRQVRFCQRRPGMIESHARKLIEKFSILSYREKVIKANCLSKWEKRIMNNAGYSINLALGEHLLEARNSCKSLRSLQAFMGHLHKIEVMNLKLAMKMNPSRAGLPYTVMAPVATKTMVSGSGTAFTLKVKA